MRHATDEEAKVIWERVEAWWKDAPAGSVFHDCKSITKRSVAEYLANQQNITMYEGCAS
jgi:hypothetical protein